ncbi:hypothetical protein HU200_020635 [Digitaria exilis]|uniref:Heat shock 70 kDa protein 14 n=1 Tax=Digitaria exilis TaxID=1010633 RepID=A0A835F0U2_9POAL|nr:hypothetical protein HU200_020635 [Digitaria exilis]
MVNDVFPFSIALSWKPDAQNNETQQTVVFPKGNAIPSVKALTFYRANTFTIDVVKVDANDGQIEQKISTYTIGPFQSRNGEKAKLKLKVRLNIHGIVSVESATMLEEEEVEVPVSATNEAQKEATKMDTDDAHPASGTDVNMEEPKGATDAAEGSENGAPTSEEKSVPMDTDAKAETSKKKVKKTNVPVSEVVHGALGADELNKAVEKEYEMALQDRVMEETKEKKNAVEAYVYDMRNKLYDKYSDFVTPEEKEGLIAKLQEVEDWLYEDGEDETKGVYIAKLEELKKVGDPIEARFKEWETRDSSVNQLVYCINSFREAALSNDQKFEHIDISEKQKVINECSEAEAWLLEKKQQQDSLPKHANPVLLSSDLKKKAETLDRLMMDFLFQLLCHGKPDAQNNDTQQTVVLPKGNVIPSSKALAFYRASTFAVDVVNVGANDAQVEPKVSTYTMLEEDEVEVPVSATNEAQKEATKMDTDDTPNDPASGTDVNMESKGATDTAEGAENGARTVV